MKSKAGVASSITVKPFLPSNESKTWFYSGRGTAGRLILYRTFNSSQLSMSSLLMNFTSLIRSRRLGPEALRSRSPEESQRTDANRWDGRKSSPSE
ncbi:hypothetical protein EYF80_056728 [Liparis tanakae]|uniref:Uncharacterized protein n=1 Tax=Liparis tanakae TaxID=230148 RepID=A0A4Z2EW35_9TELE|nr:hypothetical protein EYF80_056728 [Liparis tanakae]